MHLVEVAKLHGEFQKRDCGIVAVAQGVPGVLKMFLGHHPLNFPIFSDAPRAVYKAFGLERIRRRVFFRPSVIWGYVKLIFRGGKVRWPFAGEDVRQLGGDFLLDRNGEILWAYRSENPMDRPSAEDLLKEVERLAKSN